jgi:hypothetical protein
MILRYEGVYILKGNVEACLRWRKYLIEQKGFDVDGFGGLLLDSYR